MKFFSLLFFITIFLPACSRHSAPHKTTSSTVTSNSSTTTIPNVTAHSNSSNAEPAPVSPSSAYTKPLIIVDGRGNILVTEKNLPPDASASILDIDNARGFTPEQINKLAYRFKTIPPKILYVPPSLAKKSSRGTYYVYNKKFYFWKKSDGYFYLDETYYN